MTKDEIRFEVDQLRKDKIIYATEACATVLICILVFIVSESYFPSGLRSLIAIAVLVIGIGYTIYIGITNFIRLKRIMDLEKKLKL